MVGETKMQKLIGAMKPALSAGVYVFATVPHGSPVPVSNALMTFEEAEGKTLIMLSEAAEAAGLDATFRSRMITLNVHSSLDAIGFLARITDALAKRAIPTNPVSGFFHDHLFVPEDRADEAMAALSALAAGDQP
ncbi:MAG: ACT domain-containing protein [Pseudomonadota bacterium]